MNKHDKATRAERFWSKVPVRSPWPEDCWEWKGCFGGGRRGEYGKFEANGPFAYAHRAAWILTGSEIPSDLEIDHACRNPKCVRPEHLSLVDPGYNIAQGRATRNARWRAKTHCKRGHELSGGNLRRQGPGGKWRLCLTCKLARNKAYKEMARGAAR